MDTLGAKLRLSFRAPVRVSFVGFALFYSAYWFQSNKIQPSFDALDCRSLGANYWAAGGGGDLYLFDGILRGYLFPLLLALAFELPWPPRPRAVLHRVVLAL